LILESENPALRKKISDTEFLTEMEKKDVSKQNKLHGVGDDIIDYSLYPRITHD